jgi:hypothetical protein
MNTKDTRSKIKQNRRKVMVTVDYDLFNKEQFKIFRKNARKGYHFFRPDTVGTPTPRSAREAWGGVYKPDVTDKHEIRNQRIMFVIVALVLIGLSVL